LTGCYPPLSGPTDCHPCHAARLVSATAAPPLDPAGAENHIGFAWRPDALPQLQAFTGQGLRHARVLEPVDHRTDEEPVALAITFAAGYLAIYNHRDDNGLLFEPADQGGRER
jgi:hypothetical protein